MLKTFSQLRQKYPQEALSYTIVFVLYGLVLFFLLIVRFGLFYCEQALDLARLLYILSLPIQVICWPLDLIFYQWNGSLDFIADLLFVIFWLFLFYKLFHTRLPSRVYIVLMVILAIWLLSWPVIRTLDTFNLLVMPMDELFGDI